MWDALIIGAGAAGSYCALTAAGRGRRVALLEKNGQLGAKIRVSGGGRCNLTNLNLSSANYLSANPPFCRGALSRHRPEDFLDWLWAQGLDTEEKAPGQLFCRQKSRGLIAALEEALQRAGVTLFYHEAAERVVWADDHFLINDRHRARRLVVASGSPAYPKLGASDWALRLAKQFGIKNTPFTPALVPLLLPAPWPELSGLSTEVVGWTGPSPRYRDSLLFSHRGLSGPVILQLSSHWQRGAPLWLNFLPEGPPPLPPTATLAKALTAVLPARLAATLAPEPKPLAQWRKADLNAALARLQAWPFQPSGTEGMHKAEVCRGGIDTRELDPRTLAVKRFPALHFIGEAVDVTGELGGYNLQWAWSSGWVCGQAL